MVRRRASLSSRSGSQTISETAADDAGDGQSSLGDFG
jgi:hypothetical protein